MIVLHRLTHPDQPFHLNPDLIQTVRGIGYTLARTQIQSCDFSSGSYSYVADNDVSLSTFSVDHDKQYRIPLIKAATKAAGGQLKLDHEIGAKAEHH